jgi:mRNA-degrading endonuclease YafQ of YafQ-DinJ toxin-antitoxin module
LAGSEKISNHAAHDSSGGSTVLHQTSSLAGGISRKSVSPLDFSSTQNY